MPHIDVDGPKLRFTGPQAEWFLDQLLTNRIDAIADGAQIESLLLNHKGRIQSFQRIVRSGDALLMHVEGPSPLEFFEGRVFATQVEIEDVTSAFLIRRTPERERIQDTWLPVHEANDSSDALPAKEYERIRLEMGIPVFGVDFDEKYLVQEAAMERVVAFDKGCYLGQETVAMAQRGSVLRRMRRLVFDEQALLGRVVYDDSPAGKVTSAEGVFAIATISTEVTEGALVEVEGAKARVEEMPGTNYGPWAPSARELRERLG